MSGLEEMPENMEWKDPVIWSHSQQVRGVWNNEKITSVLSLTGCLSNSKDLLACGDDTGLIRLFKYPCTQQQVENQMQSLIPCLLLTFTRNLCSQAGFVQRRQGSGSIRCLSFLTGDRLLVSSDSAGSLLIWRLEERQESRSR